MKTTRFLASARLSATSRVASIPLLESTRAPVTVIPASCRSFQSNTTSPLLCNPNRRIATPRQLHNPSSARLPPNNTTRHAARFSTATTLPQEPIIESSYEPKTGTWQYIVADPSTHEAVIIDSVLDYDAATQVISTQTADKLLTLIAQKGYKVQRILETHAHADHLTAASYLQDRIAQQQGHKPPICIGKRITEVQKRFAQTYGVPTEEYIGVFDILFEDDDVFQIGGLMVTVMHLPGHTPDHIGYKIGDNVFCGDSLFHADIGTARCDFPGGDASSLWNSGHKLLQLADHTKIWTGHDYVSAARAEPVPWMSVRDHKQWNKHLAQGITREEFVSQRRERDASLAAPKLLGPSLQINIRAGRLPSPTELGQRLLHLPLNLKVPEWST